MKNLIVVAALLLGNYALAAGHDKKAHSKCDKEKDAAKKAACMDAEKAAAAAPAGEAKK